MKKSLLLAIGALSLTSFTKEGTFMYQPEEKQLDLNKTPVNTIVNSANKMKGCYLY